MAGFHHMPSCPDAKYPAPGAALGLLFPAIAGRWCNTVAAAMLVQGGLLTWLQLFAATREVVILK
jgi:hypothetical protein